MKKIKLQNQIEIKLLKKIKNRINLLKKKIKKKKLKAFTPLYSKT